MQLSEFKRKVRLAWHLLLSHDYRAVRATGVYDPTYMQQVCSSLSLDPAEPLWTYMQKSGDDFLAEGELLEKGWMQFPDPHPLFDTAYYLCRYFPHGLQQNPYAHYLLEGWKKGYIPGPFFKEELPSLKTNKMTICPLVHYAENSLQKFSGGWFDTTYYLDKAPALEPFRSQIVRHYKFYGGRESKSPSPLFNPEHYLEQLSTEQRERARSDPFSHYICTFVLQKKNPVAYPSPFFDPYWHCEQWGMAATEENIRTYLLGAEQREYVGKGIARLVEKPVVSLLVPVYNPRLHHLNNCIRSVLFQTYPHWQLCLVDDGSQAPAVRERLLFWAERDSRIQVQFLDQNSGIAGATNAAAAMAKGEFIGFLDNDDELRADCLEQMVAAQYKTQAELIYTDEDLIGEDGTQLSLFRKPAYNSRLLFSHNYITHFVMVRRKLFLEVGGLDAEYNGAQDYDLMLKLSERTAKIHHLAEPLYHWRAIESSTSINHDEKGYANENGRKALSAALLRRGIAGCAARSELSFFYHIDPVISPVASHIFVWRALEEGVDTYENSQLEELAQLKQRDMEVHFVESAVRDRAVVLSQAVCNTEGSGGFLVFIEQPFLGVAENWLVLLQAAFFDNQVGLVSGRCRFSGGDGPSYLLPDLTQHSTSWYAKFLSSHSLHANGMHCLQDMLCPGFGLVAVRRTLFERMGGFREKYSQLAMADLALRIRREGYDVVYTPQAWIDFPAERRLASPGDSGEEKRQFQLEWQRELRQGRQYYNQSLLTDAGIDQAAFSSWFFGGDEESLP